MRTFIRLLVAACLLPAAVHAADPVTDALQAAYAPYRQALFLTNQNAPAEAERSMRAASQALQAVAGRFGATRPTPYAGDSAFGETLQRVEALYAAALQAVKAGELSRAHETLEGVRDELARLRQRNGVVTFSDHMNAYHEQMEQVLDQGLRLVDTPDAALQLMALAAPLDYLARRLAAEAPNAWAQDTAFTAGLQAVRASAERLVKAVLRGDRAEVRNAIDGLKQPYARLFVKYG